MRVLIKGGVWKNTEDEILKAAVMKYGKNQWARVASLLSRKSAKQCKARWYEWLDPSIKKTEWHRDEEEKLLHLAKLMPNQWRTIAPIVGRTAAQCMEHYEKLLDQAQESMEGSSSSSASATVAADDPRRLRPGEIDPTPETKPARPDPIDMDDDEKEMLSEARARLANTVGKKVKRKARERQLEEARKLTILQKRRELRAAGLESKLGGGAKKRKYIDYAKEIPFQKVAPVGFYDVGEENEQSRKLAKSINPKQMGLDVAKLEGRHAAEEEDRLKAQDQARLKKLFKANAPLAVMKVNDQQDAAGSLRRRTALSLPSPQVSDMELEDIVRMGQHSMSTMAAIEGEEGAGGATTQALIGDYSAVYAPQTLGQGEGHGHPQGAARTPMHEDVIMQEARNQRVLREMTPLVEQEDGAQGLGALYEGTGFQGMNPRKAVMATPNTVLAATPAGAGVVDTPMSVASHGSKQSFGSGPRAGKSSLVRDQFGLNDPAGASFRGGGSVGSATGGGAANGDVDIDSVYENEDESDNQSTVSMSTFGGSASVGGRSELLGGLKALPEPEFTYAFKIPELPAPKRTSLSQRITVEDDDDDDGEYQNSMGPGAGAGEEEEEEEEEEEVVRHAGSSAYVEDQADMEERDARLRVDKQRRELESRSTVFRRAHVDAQAMLRPTGVSKVLLEAKANTQAGAPSQLIRDEMCALVAYDSYLAPVEPVGSLNKVQAQHYSGCVASLTDSSNIKGGITKYPGSVGGKYMAEARELIADESQEPMSAEEFGHLWEEEFKTTSFNPTACGGAGGFGVPSNKAEVGCLFLVVCLVV